MPNTKVSAVSVDDCDVLYEKIMCSHHSCTAHYDGKKCSTKVNSSSQATQNHQCKCQLVESEYPNYAAEELALFLKLESDLQLGQCSADVKVETLPEEIIDLGMETLHADNPTNSAGTKNSLDPTECEVLCGNCEKSSDPGEDSDSNDCEIMWVRSTNSLDPCTDQPAKELMTKSESQPPKTSPKNDRLQNDPKQELEYDSVPLATRIYDLSPLKQAKKELEGAMKNNQNKTSYHHCDVCKFSAASMYDLKLHLLGHVDDTKGNVEIYNKSIAALEDLRSRMKINEIRKHMCTFCGKSFWTRRQLWHHKMVFHAEKRPWQCRYCYKNYTRNTHLRRHELSHGE